MTVGSKRVLWVDDEKGLLSGYREELIEQGFDLDFVDNLDDAVKKIQDPTREYDIVIWDMSMPPGEYFRAFGAQLNGGMSAGRLFHQLVRRTSPNTKTVLFTNFRDIVVDWDNPASGEFAVAKRDYRPWRLAELLNTILLESSSAHRRSAD